ncbi:hypothetical protein VCRA2116O30_370035 [Vibrio crassostreae]|nr:hypothetical protein VCRA2116O30_370035 [Vibrio crassostreae]CDT82364.1 hypothetical protein VCR29J2_680198 [Vibrio coralliirubri]CAK2535597.1 hypothetical protein VCRA2119O52_600035 [Vibrio crassostreae]CAK3426698.1 hypothetical protein VCRA2120O64_390035 [Vibrio crassostreae]CAK3929377.1 hypothetical protein VCRA2121O71_380035 [Vibrio crassostreae]
MCIMNEANITLKWIAKLLSKSHFITRLNVKRPQMESCDHHVTLSFA